MKIILTADTHFGYKNTAHTLWAVRTMREYAASHGIEQVFILGDLFHNRKSLDVDTLGVVYDFFDETTFKYEQEWLCFPGNHDMFLKNSWEVNSLRPLRHVLKVVESYSRLEVGGRRFWVIPFINYEPAYMDVLQKVNERAEENDVLLTHIGATGATLNECFLIKNWSMIEFSWTKFKHIYAGHFHCYQEVGKLTYCGSPIPLRFDEGMVDHGFVVLDLETDEEKFVPIFEVGEREGKPPDYLTVPDDEKDVEVAGDNVRVLLTKDYTEQELDTIREEYMEKGAKSVHWMRQKEEAIDIADEIDPMFGSPEEMFVKFLEHDKPEDLDESFLLELNKSIAVEANDIIASMEIE